MTCSGNCKNCTITFCKEQTITNNGNKVIEDIIAIAKDKGE